jgi:DNA replication protein DnaC
MTMLTHERVRDNLGKLRLQRVAQVLDSVAEEAARANLPYLDFLDRLLEEEAAARYQRAVAFKTKMARFPFIKTLEQFDFSFQPSIDQRQIKELTTLRFIENGENIIFLGPPGVGKTHLAIALGLKAVAQGYGVYFITVHELIDALARDYSENRVAERMKLLCRPKLLIIDEMGYLPLDRMGASFFFQLVSRRYEKGSIIITSNRSYGDWGSIFSDSIIASAILDRLLHHSTTINIRGESYRLREKKKAGIFQKVKEDSKEP